MPATVHLRVSVMTQRQTVRPTSSYCTATPAGRSPANLLFIHPFIYLLRNFIHPHAPPSPALFFFSPANTTPPPAALLIEVSALLDLAVNSWSVVVNYEWLFQVKARGSGPERTFGGKAGINYCPAHAFSGWQGGRGEKGVLAIHVSEGEWICTLRSGMIPCDFFFAWNGWYNACLRVWEQKTGEHQSWGFYDL